MYSLLEDSPGPVNTYFTSATAMDFVQHEGGHEPRGGVGLRKRRVTKSWTKSVPSFRVAHEKRGCEISVNRIWMFNPALWWSCNSGRAGVAGRTSIRVCHRLPACRQDG